MPDLACSPLWVPVPFCLVEILLSFSRRLRQSAPDCWTSSAAVGRLPTTVLSETRGLQLFRVIREGIGFTQRLRCHCTVRLQGLRILTLDPERRQNDSPTASKGSPENGGLSTEDAQAACDFSFSASKLSPFFHSVRAMAANLRASVSRAIAGVMPLASTAR